MRWPVLVAATALATTLWAADPPAAVRRHGSGVVVLSELPDLLAEPRINQELMSGLTNSFLVEVSTRKAKGRTVKGAAQVNIRFEPWDELFFATTRGPDGVSRNITLPSTAALHAWWQELELPVAVADGLAAGTELEVELRFVPFSLSEQEDTQRWLADGARPDSRNPIADTPAVGGGGATSRGRVLDGQTSTGRVLDVLVATSISRRALVSFRWTVSLEVRRASEEDPDPDHGGGDSGPRSPPDA